MKFQQWLFKVLRKENTSTNAYGQHENSNTVCGGHTIHNHLTVWNCMREFYKPVAFLAPWCTSASVFSWSGAASLLLIWAISRQVTNVTAVVAFSVLFHLLRTVSYNMALLTTPTETIVKVMINKQSSVNGVDFNETYRISRVHGTNNLYQECIKSDQ